MSEYLLARDGHRARAGGVWTQDKLGYMRKYAEAFMIAMAPKRAAGKWDQLVFIDPLCGPGVDIEKRSNREFPGSPSIALAVSPAFDRLYLGDLDPGNVQALTARMSVSDKARVSLKAEDCHARAQAVVAAMSRKTLGLAFVTRRGSRFTSSCSRRSRAGR